MVDSSKNVRNAVGVMTGTSMDGIDAALVRIEDRGLAMRVTLTAHRSTTLGDLQRPLRDAARQQPMAAGELARLAWAFGELHAQVIESLPPHPLSLICIHGQTVFHQPPISWQLVNPAPIAARFPCPIVSDLRQADLAHGGQGAPLTPLADWILFRDPTHARAIINLGGFCNVTIIPAQRAGPSSTSMDSVLHGIRGFDVCACNQLLDAIARDALGKPFDEDGAAASRGAVEPQAAADLRAILDCQRFARRSLGTGDEALRWIADHWSRLGGDDLAASAVQAIAQTIAGAASEHRVDELILAGGGARNGGLRAALHAASGSAVAIRFSDDLGVPLDAREAMCFAVLGALCQDSVPITLPQVTGCNGPAPISGVWTSHNRLDNALSS